MSRKEKKPTLNELTATLEKDIAQWQEIHEFGCMDPTWSDGVNTNLCRNHIIYDRQIMQQEYPNEKKPDIFYKAIPEELPSDYMARKEEILAAAQKSLAVYQKNTDYRYLCDHYARVPQKEAQRMCLFAVMGYVKYLESAILSGDYITMRRHEFSERYLDSFQRAAQQLRGWTPPENEQLSMFFDCSTLDETDGQEDGCEWEMGMG